MNKDKAIKKLGQMTVDEMDAMRPEELKKIIVEANTAMKQVKEELEANPKYQEAKANVDSLSQGKKDVDSRQKMKIQYSLEILDSLGKLDEVGLMQWERDREERLMALEVSKKEAARIAYEQASSPVRHLVKGGKSA